MLRRAVVGLWLLLAGSQGSEARERTYVQFLYDTSGSFTMRQTNVMSKMFMVLQGMMYGDGYLYSPIRGCGDTGFDPRYDLDLHSKYYQGQIERSLWELMEFLRITRTMSVTPVAETSDILGAVEKAGQALDGTNSGRKYLIIFSDMQSMPRLGCATHQRLSRNLKGVEVIIVGIDETRSNGVGVVECTRSRWTDLLYAAGAARVVFTDDEDTLKFEISQLRTDYPSARLRSNRCTS